MGVSQSLSPYNPRTQGLLTANSESSGGNLGQSSLSASNDAATALLLEQIMQERRQRQQQNDGRFFPR